MNVLEYIFVITLTACSLAGLFIGKIDYFIADSIDDKLDLSRKQEERIEKDIAKLLNKIKPQVESMNKSIQLEVLNDDQLLQSLIPIITQTYLSIVNKFADLLIKNLDSFEQDQKVKLVNELKNSIQKFEKKFKENKFYKIIPERIEKFTGELSKKQKKIFKKKGET